MMRKVLIVLLAVAFVGALSAPASAEISFFGTGKIKPTYYSNFDFNSDLGDRPVFNEAGFIAGEHVRSELRLGWRAGGDNWKVLFIAESDLVFEKDTADRSFYTDAEKRGQPNAGAEFGIERVELNYTFNPMLTLSTGWNIRGLDMGTGGILFGDDHPFIGFSGKLGDIAKYELLYITINNRDEFRDVLGLSDDGDAAATPATLADSPVAGDWRAYSLKVDFTLPLGGANKLTVSPLVALSDVRATEATVNYYGIEAIGQFGFVKPSFEFIYADGEIDATATQTSADIKAMAAFAGVEFALSKALNPYVAIRYTSGDDNSGDTDVEGFVGITDIGRFTPLMGMDGNILGEHLASGASPYNSPLYSYAPDRAVGGRVYGGIGLASSGNNPGSQILAFGSKGALSEKFSYKAQAFLIWYDTTENLVNVKSPGSEVDDYAGTTLDVQLMYAFSKNFAADIILSGFQPGDGIDDQINSDDLGYLASLTLAWTF